MSASPSRFTTYSTPPVKRAQQQQAAASPSSRERHAGSPLSFRSYKPDNGINGDDRAIRRHSTTDDGDDGDRYVVGHDGDTCGAEGGRGKEDDEEAVYVTPDSARAAARPSGTVRVIYSDVESNQRQTPKVARTDQERRIVYHSSKSDSETETESESESETEESSLTTTTDYVDSDQSSEHTSSMEDEDGCERPTIDFDEPIYLSVGMRIPPPIDDVEADDKDKQSLSSRDDDEAGATVVDMYVDYQQEQPEQPSDEPALARGNQRIQEGLKRRRRSVDFFDYHRKSHSVEKDKDKKEARTTKRRSSICITSSYALPPSSSCHSEYISMVSRSQTIIVGEGEETQKPEILVSVETDCVREERRDKIVLRTDTSSDEAVTQAAMAASLQGAAGVAVRQMSEEAEGHLSSRCGTESDDGYVAISKQLRAQLGDDGIEAMDDQTISAYVELGTKLVHDIRDTELKHRFMQFLSILPQESRSRKTIFSMFLGKQSERPDPDDGEVEWPLLKPEKPQSSDKPKRRTKKEKGVDDEKKRRREKKRSEKIAKKEKKEMRKQRRCNAIDQAEKSDGQHSKPKETERNVQTSPARIRGGDATPKQYEHADGEKRRRDKWRERRQERRRDKEEKKEKKEQKEKSSEDRVRKSSSKPEPKPALIQPSLTSSEKNSRTRRRLKKETSGLTKKDMAFDRQWNEEFQSLLDKGVEKLALDDMRKISKLMYDFVYNAETYAKVIINELNVDYKKKTIKPAGVGGVAGGEKYIVQGILFKFCRDPMISQNPPMWLYGGWRPVDHYAMKAAGLELQGLALIANPRVLQDIRHPLMALIDYKGFRIVATCILPLGPNSLCYGSSDGGKTVLASDPVFNEAMDKVGKLLNLKKHTVGRQRVPIVGPGDCEGHLGSDGRYYMLDYARLMPPEAPEITEDDTGDRSVFFKMLRPEIVQRYPKPLSSDAFTGWSKYDTDIDNSEREIRLATKMLMEDAIPSLARELDATDISDVIAHLSVDASELDLHRVHVDIVERINLVYRMHSRGINMRHLGRLRQHVTSADWKFIIMCEAMSRLAKQMIRGKMREAMTQSFGVSSESLCKDLILEYFNSVIGSSPHRRMFIEKQVKPSLNEKFPHLLTPEELAPDYLLQTQVSLRYVFILEKKMHIIRATEHITYKLLSDPLGAVRILPNDIEAMVASVKRPPLSHLFDAAMYIIEALDGDCNDSEAVRLLETALDHFTTASNVMPCVPFIMWGMGRVETEIARRRPFNDVTEALLVQAVTNHRRSILLELAAGPVNSLATTLELYATRLEESEQQRARASLTAFCSVPSSARGDPTLSSSAKRRLGHSAAALMMRSTSSPLPSEAQPGSASPARSVPGDASSAVPPPINKSKPTLISLSSLNHISFRGVFPTLSTMVVSALFSSPSSFIATLGSSLPADQRIVRLRTEAAMLRKLASTLAPDSHPLFHNSTPLGQCQPTITRLIGT